MKRLTTLAAALAVSLAILLTGCQSAAPAAAPAASGAKQEMPLTNWRLHATQPVGSPTVKLLQRFADEAAQRTNGKLKIAVYPGESLGYTSADMARVMQAGLVEVAQIDFGQVSGDNPIFGVGELPVIIRNNGDAELAIKAAVPYYQKGFEKLNSKWLMSWARPVSHMLAKKPVVKIEDFKGLKVRTWNPELTKTLTALGSTPVTMPAGDTYMSVSTGVIDGVVWGAASALDYKLYEVAPHMSLWNLIMLNQALVINNKALASLPKDVQDMLINLGAELQPEAWKTVFYIEEDNFKVLKEKGMKTYTVAPAERAKLEALMPQVWNDWLTKTGADGKAALNDILKATGRPALN